MRTLVPLGSLLLALVCAVSAPSCGETAAASPRATLIEPEHDGFWWTYLGEQSSAVANFGPSFETPLGLFRQWCLVIHLPGTPEPLSCIQGLVDYEQDDPIAVRGENFALELRPRELHRWGDVRSTEQLAPSVEGLY